MLFKPWYILMVGLPGSGKSTIIKKMKHPDNYSILSTDWYIEKFAESVNKTYTEVFQDAIGLATKTFNYELIAHLDLGFNIIHHQTNLSIGKRKSVLAKIPNNYYKICCHVICNLDELKIRLAHRPGKIITPELLESMCQQYESPILEEGFDYVEECNTSCT